MQVDRQTDKQPDRQADRPTDSPPDRQTDRESRDRQTAREHMYYGATTTSSDAMHGGTSSGRVYIMDQC